MNDEARYYTYICVGKTGTGKSSLCNTIIGEEKFIESDSGTSVTAAPKLESAVHLNYNITIIDTPGVMDTSVTSEQAKKKSDEMIEAMSQCPAQGKRALLLVLKYGDRFTEENRKCVDIIETIFGEQCLEKCFIVVFTHGEVFDINYEERNISFEDWCRSQGGDLGQLLRKCEYRCLLFRNKSRDTEVIRQQFDRLILVTDSLDESYTNEKFESARMKHSRLYLESILPDLLIDFDNQLNQLQEIVNSNIVQNISMQDLMIFIQTINDIVCNIEQRDAGIYYSQGESSLFSQPKLRAKQMQKQIHIQQIQKVKLELTTSLNQLNFKLIQCESLSTLDQLENEMKHCFDRLLEFGLVIDRDNITIDGSNNVINFLSEDMQHFEEVKISIRELDDALRVKRNSLLSELSQRELKRKIRFLRRRLNAIQTSETNSDQAIQIREEARNILNTTPHTDSVEQFLEQLKDIEEEAAMKVDLCEGNRRAMIFDAAVSTVTGAMGAVGSAASLSRHAVARGVTRVMPSVISITKSCSDVIRRKFR